MRSGTRWRATPRRILERTVGVIAVVKFGDTPGRCPHGFIAELIARTDLDGVIRLSARPPPLSTPRLIAPGATVAIADGPFRGLDAIYAGQTAHERELVLINILGASRPVEIAAGLVVPH